MMISYAGLLDQKYKGNKLKKYNEPWPHIIEDNYIDQKNFEQVKNEIIGFVKKQKINLGITIFDNPDLSQDTVNYLDKYTINQHFIKKHFKDHRSFKKLKIKNEIILCVGSSEFIKHCDAENKVLSLVTYIHPAKSVGTLIYNKNKDFIKEVEWRPNRALIFAPLTDVTWHSYKSNKNEFRITFNKFLIIEE
jgi:hypothetical protein